jgi:hypothetical protein
LDFTDAFRAEQTSVATVQAEGKQLGIAELKSATYNKALKGDRQAKELFDGICKSDKSERDPLEGMTILEAKAYLDELKRVALGPSPRERLDALLAKDGIHVRIVPPVETPAEPREVSNAGLPPEPTSSTTTSSPTLGLPPGVVPGRMQDVQQAIWDMDAETEYIETEQASPLCPHFP